MALHSLLIVNLLLSLTLSTAFQLGPIRLVRDNAGAIAGTISLGWKVGGRSEVKNVESNKDVQDLGRFAVQEYNRWIRENHTSSEKLLSFSQVVEAQRQVVSGLKYYMQVVTHEKSEGHGKRVFDAVVWVKPWLASRLLISFEPARN